jgi:hypothetical protein
MILDDIVLEEGTTRHCDRCGHEGAKQVGWEWDGDEHGENDFSLCIDCITQLYEQNCLRPIRPTRRGY